MTRNNAPKTDELANEIAGKGVTKRFVSAKTKASTQPKRMRFVLYAWKSSEEEGAQAKSLDDQINECRKYAERENLNVVKTLRESASAKKSYNRPVFTQMLLDIVAGKYDGILAWHPDRLARNALESGMIIDLLDNQIIKELKFPTLLFENNASGKLTLNIHFAMAKQYSEHLSESVQRGVDSNLEQGKSSGVPKWGYNRSDITGYYEPDDNFDLIKEGWEMRANGATIDEVVAFWKQHNVHRMTKITKKNKKQRKITITSNMASTLFHDPFYYGILCQSGQEVDLRELNPNFKPMIDEQTFNTVQALSCKTKKAGFGRHKHEVFYPFRELVFCAECGSCMKVGKSRSRDGSYYLYYRCDNKDCSTKSVRAKTLLDDLYKKLDSLNFTAKEYRKLVDVLQGHTDEILSKLRSEKLSLQGALNHQKHSVEELARQYAALPVDAPSSVRNVLQADLESAQNDVIDTESRLRDVESRIIDPEQAKMKEDEFLNLTNSLGDKMRAGSAVEKDQLARILLLNIKLDNKNAPSYLWKEPFATLLKTRKNQSGARDWT